MKLNRTFPGKILLIVLAGLLAAGCSGTTPTPATVIATQDPAVVVEMVVGTVNAQMTEQALQNPTATLEPTATLAPTATATLEPTFTPTIGITDTPAATSTATSAPLTAKLLYVATIPENKREYVPNENFTLEIGFENAGNVEWGPDYYIQLVRVDGEDTVNDDRVVLNKGVKPGEKAIFDIGGFGSETLGVHTWYFQLHNGAGGPVPGGFATFTYTSY